MISKNSIKIAEILGKKFLNDEELSAQEQMVLDKWLEESEQNRNFYRDYSLEREIADFDRITRLSSSRNQWAHMNRRRERRWIRYAAAVVMLAGISAALLWWGEQPPQLQTAVADQSYSGTVGTKAYLILNGGQTVQIDTTEQVIEDRGSVIRITSGTVTYQPTNDTFPAEKIFNTIRVPRQGVYTMTLSDGTKVFLNPGSELKYPVAFDDSLREVSLKGEAHFEVTHNPEKPFVVAAGNNRIKVLGTSFIVSVYQDEPFNTASLLEGAIEITNGEGSVRRVLTPGKRAVWKEGGQGIVVEEFNVEHLRQLRDGVVVLEETDLRSIMRMLSRWFDMDLEYCGDTSVNHSISVKFTRNDDLGQILDRITKVGGPKFSIVDTMIYVY